MKLNKYILGLLIAPAFALAGCSDYEDTEIASPQADENTIGANFSAASTPVVMHPDKTSFTLTLNRVNTKGAVSVPVTVASCDEVSTGTKFCDQPTAFLFADGEATAKITLNVNAACLFQKTYKMALTIGEKKDHLYAQGTTSTIVSFTKDYTWKTLGQPVILEDEKGWVGKGAGILAPVEWASDYKNDNGNMLFRIKALYAYAGKGSNTTTGHLQFFLDENYAPVTERFSTNGYDPANIDTGIQQNKPADPKEEQEEADKIYYKLDFTGVTGGTYTEKTEDGETIKVLTTPYEFSYRVFYTPGEEITSVKATLDFDILNTMEAIKAKLK